MTRVAMLLDQQWNTVPGGTARSVVSLCDALAAHGTELVGVHGRYSSEPGVALPASITTQTLPFPGRALTQLWSRTGQPRPDRWLDADVLHAAAYVLPQTGLATVVTIHDLAFVRHPEWFSSRGVAYLTRFLDRVRNGDMLVIVPSAHTAQDCVRAGIDEARIRVIPWGVHIPEIGNVHTASVRSTYGLPDRFVLYVGTMEPRKNLDGLGAALDLLDDVPLVLVGPDGWGDANATGLRLPALPRAELDAVMAAASLLVYPSHFEGFGLPVLEAMAVGTPVVTTAGTSQAEILGDGGLSVDTRVPQALADGIDALLGDSELAARCGRAGLERARTYSWERTALETQRVYEAAQR